MINLPLCFKMGLGQFFSFSETHHAKNHHTFQGWGPTHHTLSVAGRTFCLPPPDTPRHGPQRGLILFIRLSRDLTRKGGLVTLKRLRKATHLLSCNFSSRFHWTINFKNCVNRGTSQRATKTSHDYFNLKTIYFNLKRKWGAGTL